MNRDMKDALNFLCF